MKKKFIWLIVSCLMVVALVLASCKAPVTEKKEVKGVVTEPEKKVEKVEEVVEKVGPQYGGKLTFFHFWAWEEPGNWDIKDIGSKNPPRLYSNPYTEWLLRGDVEKYGPRGTNEFPFSLVEYIPEQFLGGCIAESYETPDPKTIIFHIRKGVMFTGNAHIGMLPREVTADDVVFNLNRMEEKRPGLISFFVDTITATDKYTVVVKCKEFFSDWPYYLGYNSTGGINPPEMVEAGAEDWRNHVGTGPFIITDWVDGAGATYERNPTYWGTTTINGKEYQLPFIDKLVYPLIVDESTQLAALRTGKLDYHGKIPLVYEDTLTQTCPELIQYKFYYTHPHLVGFKCTSEYFDDVNVRRAMHIGTDLQAIKNAIYMGQGELHSNPIHPDAVGIYTPLEELPESVRGLYNYDPVKAKQMLADAGYPQGFAIEMCLSAGKPEDQDIAAMLVEQWAKIDVEVTLDVVEDMWRVMCAQDYEHTILHDWGNCNPFTKMKVALPTYKAWIPQWEDEYFLEGYWKAAATMDPAERNAILKDIAVYWAEQVPYIGFTQSLKLQCWWPWVKNFYGEYETGFNNQMPMISRLWIDQDLKAELGH